MIPQTGTAPILEMRSISKSFYGTSVLNKINLKVKAGQVVALMGENGAGKSTLMKILSGVWPKGEYDGEILIQGRKVEFRNTREAMQGGIAMIHQELSVFPELTVAEHLELDQLPNWIHWDEIFQKTQKFLDGIGFPIQADAKLKDLSVGNQQIVEIARALYRDAQILIFDEPTSALTEREVQRLYALVDQLREQGKAILYITHRFDEVFRLADLLVVLRDGHLVTEIDTSDGGTKKSRQELEPALIRWMVGRAIDDIYPAKLPSQDRELFRAEKLSLKSPSGKVLLDRVSFSLKEGEVLGIAGLLGAGRSELFDVLFGIFNETGPKGEGYEISGRAWKKGIHLNLQCPGGAIRSKLAYVSEDRKGNGLVLDQSILNNLVLPTLTKGNGLFSWLNQEEIYSQAERWLQLLRVKASSIDQPVKELSGGNQQKIVLAKWLMSEPELILLDEPTRGIDVGAKVEIYHWIQKLASQGMGIILASSEMPELLGLCHRVIVLRNGSMTSEMTAQEVTQEKIMRAASL